jgi:hypothetical protein
VSFGVPAGVTKIGAGAFRGCDALSSLSVAAGSKLAEIGTGAFDGCKALVSFEVPAGVAKIWAGAFGGCEALRSVVLRGRRSLPGVWQSEFPKGCRFAFQ